MHIKIMYKSSNARIIIETKRKKSVSRGSKHALYQISLALNGRTNIENHSTVS